MTTEKLYTLQEVADYLKVSRQTIYNYKNRKQIKVKKIGGREYRVTETDLQEFIERFA